MCFLFSLVNFLKKVMNEFAARGTDLPGCTEHLLANTSHGIWSWAKITKYFNRSWDCNYIHLPKRKKKKTLWFMPQNMMLAHTHRILFSLGRLFVWWIWFLFEAFKFTEAPFFFTFLQQWELEFFFIFGTCSWGPSFPCRTLGLCFEETSIMKDHHITFNTSKLWLVYHLFYRSMNNLCTKPYREWMGFWVVQRAQIYLCWYLINL